MNTQSQNIDPVSEILAEHLFAEMLWPDEFKEYQKRKYAELLTTAKTTEAKAFARAELYRLTKKSKPE